VEVLAPVEDKRSREVLRLVLDRQLEARRSVWEMGPDGSYRQFLPSEMAEEDSESIAKVDPQEYFIQWTERRGRQATKALTKKPRVLGPRAGARQV
jgi:polyphosphate kinase